MTAFWAAFQASRSFKTTNGPSPKRRRVAGRDEGLRAYGRGVICLDRPSATQLLDAAGLPHFVVPKSRYTVMSVF